MASIRKFSLGAYRVGRIAGLCAFAGMMAACAQPKSMYNWQAYQPQVYSYLKDEGSDYAAQAQALEQNIERARAENQALPPGFRAHLGMLYLKLGQGDRAVEQLQGEKLAFPESAPFMDFLLRNVPGGKATGESASRPESSPAKEGV